LRGVDKARIVFSALNSLEVGSDLYFDFQAEDVAHSLIVGERDIYRKSEAYQQT
jgi:hypothetical protein